MVSTAELAAFGADVTHEGLPDDVREAVKRRVLDAVGVGVGAAGDGAGPTDAVRRAAPADGATGRSRPWGAEAKLPPADAAMYNAALLASGDGPTFLAPTPAPIGDVVAAVLAVAEARGATGEAVLAGLAAALEVRGELAWNAPLDEFHPATHGSVAATVGVGRTVGLSAEELADAVGLAATRATLAVGDGAFDPLAAGSGALAAVYAWLLAEGGADGPDAFADAGGWHDVVGEFDVDLDPGCERATDAALLPYDAHPYAQSAIEAAVDLAEDVALDPADVETVRVETFADAVSRLDATALAAALVDRELAVRPGERADLRPVIDAVETGAAADLTERAERGEVPARVVVECRDGAVHEADRQWFTGHPAAPASWGVVEEKFHERVGDRYDVDRRTDVVDTVRALEAETAAELSRLLD
jgi:2-methylcitrate dehydratase